MNELVIFGLFFAAIAIGWCLGRRDTRTGISPGDIFPRWGRHRDHPVESVLETLSHGAAVELGATENHIERGIQLRKQGEVEGAVRIHEDVLAQPSLSPDIVAVARLELARDYISAGLLDRAEALLLEVVQQSPVAREAGQRHLLEVYEIERDWGRAIDVAKALLPSRLRRDGQGKPPPIRRGQRAALLLSHYCCELAGEKRQAGELGSARRLLLDALVHDRQCVRASLLLGQVEFDDGHFRQAVKVLRRVRMQDPDYLPETIPLLRKAHAALGESPAMRDYLAECLAARPTAALVAAVAEDMTLDEGADAAGAFLATQLVEYPSLHGLVQLIGLQLDRSTGESRSDLALLQSLARHLVATRQTYRCGHCGFAGRQLHWHCPGCKDWGSMKPMDGPGCH